MTGAALGRVGQYKGKPWGWPQVVAPCVSYDLCQLPFEGVVLY